MFGQSKPITFDPYGRRRSRSGPPRWLVLLVIGIALGAGGVILVQERYLAPRLSAEESIQLRNTSDQAVAESRRLKAALDASIAQLEATRTDNKRLTADAATSRSGAEHAQSDLAALIASLPPDPRGGGNVAIRAAQFAVKGNALAYDVVLTRDRANPKPMTAVMQLAVAGQTARGTETTVALEPVALTIGSQQVVRGSSPLPDGFKPRQTTIQVLDRAGGKALGMRVMLVK